MKKTLPLSYLHPHTHELTTVNMVYIILTSFFGFISIYIFVCVYIHRSTHSF